MILVVWLLYSVIGPSDQTVQLISNLNTDKYPFNIPPQKKNQLKIQDYHEVPQVFLMTLWWPYDDPMSDWK